MAGERARWTDRHDPIVRLFARYQRSLDPESQIKVRHCEMEQLAAIRAAHELAQRDDPLRWRADALILAGATDAEVAERCLQEPATIVAYEAGFFAVRQALKSSCYLITRVIGPGVFRGFHDDEVREFWCWAALAGGVPLVDALAASLRAACRPGDVPRLHGYLRIRSPVPLELQAFVAASVLPHSPSPLDTTYFAWHRRLQEAGELQCPDATARARDRVARDVVRIARKVLAGEPPAPHRAAAAARQVNKGRVVAAPGVVRGPTMAEETAEAAQAACV